MRLIGVDTPETVDPRRPVQYFGKEASEFTRRMAQGKVVRLEFDVDRKDRYGRTLAYVYLPDATFLNAEIVKQGYGHAYTQFPFRCLDQFRAYEREAHDAGRGLWAAFDARQEQERFTMTPDPLFWYQATYPLSSIVAIVVGLLVAGYIFTVGLRS